MNCRICGGTRLKKFLDLGHHPPSDAFLTEKQLHEPEIHYPLDVYYCEDCSLVQLGYVVPKEILFPDDYPYTTGTNAAGVEHFRELAHSIIERYPLTSEDLVVDVGGNDGTLLEFFKDHGCKTMNVEPVAGIPSKVPKICEFWDRYWATHIKNSLGPAKVITATNVVAHIDNLHEFMRGVDILLADEGVLVIEAPSVRELIANVEYDTIYHEHLSYLDGFPLDELVRLYNMSIVYEETHDFHGGSIRYFIIRGPNCMRLYPAPLTYDGSYKDFEQKVQHNRQELRATLGVIKAAGGHIAGVCASAKGNTLLNYCKIGTETLEFITEVSKFKIGKYSPGMHIPIVSDERLIQEQPEYALMLACNFKGSIIPILREKGYKGQFILPWPKVQIYEE